MYVSEESADVWSQPEGFQLDAEGHKKMCAGVPPDYFAEDGQLWGNPLYDWAKMKKDGYAWWRRRLAHALSMYDGVRIDHFRAIEAYWAVPADAESARAGKWCRGPGKAFIRAVRELAGDRLIIAEDLGDITDEVRALAVSFTVVVASVAPMHGYLHACYFTLRSGGKTLITFLFDSGYVWCVNLALAFVLSRYSTLSPTMVYLICQGADVFKVILGTVLIARGSWANNMTEIKGERI